MKKYVKEADTKFIYEVSIGAKEDSYMILDLNLVCGIDYINPDQQYDDRQGYVRADRFVADVQTAQCVCYYWEESIQECLETNGYEVIDKLPIIY